MSVWTAETRPFLWLAGNEVTISDGNEATISDGNEATISDGNEPTISDDDFWLQSDYIIASFPGLHRVLLFGLHSI